MLPLLVVGSTFACLGGAIFLIAMAEIRSWARPSSTKDAGRVAARTGVSPNQER